MRPWSPFRPLPSWRGQPGTIAVDVSVTPTALRTGGNAGKHQSVTIARTPERRLRDWRKAPTYRVGVCRWRATADERPGRCGHGQDAAGSARRPGEVGAATRTATVCSV